MYNNKVNKKKPPLTDKTSGKKKEDLPLCAFDQWLTSVGDSPCLSAPLCSADSESGVPSPSFWWPS